MNKVEQHLKDIAASMKAAGFPPNLWVLFADHGQPYNERAKNLADLVLVNELIDKCGGKKAFKPQECYFNSQTLLALDSHQVLHYHEGYIMSNVVPVPIHHAWLTVGQMYTILDVTMDSLKRKNRDRRDEFVEYFGIEIPRELVFKNQAQTLKFSPVTENPKIAPKLFGLE